MLNKEVCLKCSERHSIKHDYAGLNEVQRILFQYERCYCAGRAFVSYHPTAIRNVNNNIMTSFVVWLMVTVTLPFLIGSWIMLALYITFQCVVLLTTICVYEEVKKLEEDTISIRSEPPVICPYLLEHTVNQKK